LVKITGTLVQYINSIKDAPKESIGLAREAATMQKTLMDLAWRIEARPHR
jgi:hypothetical protein